MLPLLWSITWRLKKAFSPEDKHSLYSVMNILLAMVSSCVSCQRLTAAHTKI